MGRHVISAQPSQERILLVDDDESFLEVMAFLLEEEGYEVVRAKNGPAAFARLQATAFSVMVTDLVEVASSAILPWPKPIRGKTSDEKHSVN